MKEKFLGIDIGGTKCAVSYGYGDGPVLHIKDKIKFPTTTKEETLLNIMITLDNMLEKHTLSTADISAVGISCGGPLDSRTGMIKSPPNLPGWDNVPIVGMVEDRYKIRTALQNDANACALAEWKYGAGRGSRNMVFMTFGTGLGAGLILNGQLYTGANDNAGELGHIRLSSHGPVGYGKAGSFEGFCSGGGIAQIAKTFLMEKMQMGVPVSWYNPMEEDTVTAQKVAEEAVKGDKLALSIFDASAEALGKGLSIVIDILNPEVIVVGGVYTRCEELMKRRMVEMIKKEALPNSVDVCEVVVSQLGEEIGDYAALSVAAALL